ncbi:MAG: hypothetical protein CSB06_03270 [Bacteroidia bacterium]|nr:MAG: hypothetical protein CSB06_03270 [Bacteroidia bacterium]
MAQQYKWQAEIQEVPKSGYYKIYLKPELVSHLKHSFPDIRLRNEEGVEIQYILKKAEFVDQEKAPESLEILKNKHRKFKHLTELVLQNTKRERISQLIFTINNTQDPVYIKLYGSNDKKKWYILRKNFPVVPEITSKDTTQITLQNIPQSNFNFFKIYFYDYNEHPIEVSAARYHSPGHIHAEYTKLPVPKITQENKRQKSFVHIHFQQAQFIDILTFNISGPEYYLREAHIKKTDTSGIEESSDAPFYDQYKKQFYFGSQKSNRLHLYDYKAKTIEIVVDNKDNKPLNFTNVSAYQIKNYLIAYLHPDTKYRLFIGNEDAKFPSYDLPYFKDTIPEILPSTRIGVLRPDKSLPKNQKPIWNSSANTLRLIIGLIGIVLIGISIKLIREKFKDLSDEPRK